MGSFTGFLFAYLLGGLTFLPLVVVAVLAHAHYTLPYREDVDPDRHDPNAIVQPADDLAGLEGARTAHKADAGNKARSKQDNEVASGYFAVCREYTPMGINARPIERATPVGSTTVAAPSQSVYQTMYRSIFDRKQGPGPLETKAAANQRPKNAGNVFYVVLRHGHIMLFDDEEQIEVRHVVSLAHHSITICSGGDVTPEGELFIKRNALCLSRRKEGAGGDGQLSKPFYLFSEDGSAKEDFYFALLRHQEQYFEMDKKAPKPTQFDVKNIITLVQKLHSSEDHQQTRWLNAMIGRVFLGLYKTADLEHMIRERLTKKIARVKRPSFLTNIVIRKIETGDSAPVLLNPRHKDLSVEGECGMEADVKYNGNFRMEVAATARLDLGARFKVREVDLVLAVVLHKLDGHVFFKIKPPPSNRVWFSFQTMPKMEMTIEPIVSSRQITYTLILRQIEHRMKEVIAETLVQPYWDDVPFFNTEHKKWRGGIWQGDDAVVISHSVETNVAQEGDVDTVNRLEEAGDIETADLKPVEKSYSAPLSDNVPPTGLFGRKLAGKTLRPSTAGVSTGIEPKSPTNSRPKTLRSNSVSSPSDPVVGTDAAHADVFKPSTSPPDHASTMMAALTARSMDNSAGQALTDSSVRPASLAKETDPPSSSSSREDTDNEKELEKTPVAPGRRSTASSMESAPADDANSSAASFASSLKGSIKSNTGSLRSNAGSLRSNQGSITKGLFRRDTTSDSINGSSQGEEQNQKRVTLAAVANAATQARQWGWNAIQRHKDARNGNAGEAEPPLDLNKPMGRGRPLPPPGTPLPPPDRTHKVTSIPVPPKRKSEPSPSLPNRPHSDDSINSAGERKPPVPTRRHRDMQEDNGNEDLFVVAAPMESEPSTPLNEEMTEYPSYASAWVEDAKESGPSSGRSRMAPDEDDQPTPLVQHRPTNKPTSMASSKSESPVEARPAQTLQDDDDDDFSGWLDNTEVEDYEPEAPPTEAKQGPAAVTAGVRS
ncbi:hypothetical protein ACHAQH_004809 [Verticillium albo-atrum]